LSKNSSINRHLLADKLIGVVDKIRRQVHAKLGTRPWSVDIVKRSWSGGRRGEGTPKLTILNLDPTPMVKRVTQDRMGPAGREAAGSVTLTGVSLRYAQAELQPIPGNADEIAYRLTELHGQQQTQKFYVLGADPVPRRGDKEGDGTDWYILLHETSAMGDLDGVTD
jgi:hypothetical protein